MFSFNIFDSLVNEDVSKCRDGVFAQDVDSIEARILALDKLDDLNYVVEDMIASPAYPDLVGTYWKGTLTPKATSNNQQAEKIINYRGMSIYRIQNNKMVETWHVIDRPPK